MEGVESVLFIVEFLSILFSILFLSLVGFGMFICGGWIIVWIVVVKRRKHAKQT